MRLVVEVRAKQLFNDGVLVDTKIQAWRRILAMYFGFFGRFFDVRRSKNKCVVSLWKLLKKITLFRGKKRAKVVNLVRKNIEKKQ